MIPKMCEDSFTWSRWRSFNLFDKLGIRARYSDIIKFKTTLRNFAIGYIEAEVLRCRPKEQCYAVMFLKDDIFSWCHFTRREFNEIFQVFR